MDTHHRNVEPLSDILHFDPYMKLSPDILYKLFDAESQDNDLTEELLLDFSYRYQDSADVFQEMLLEGFFSHRLQAEQSSNPCFDVLKRY